jgi:tetratricopeptide (TPR) repeat protein
VADGGERSARVDVPDGRGVQVGDGNVQVNDSRGQQDIHAARDAFTAGRDLHYHAVGAAAAPVALAQLPPLAAGFTGRGAELAQVAALLDPAGSAGPVVVSAVTGLAGVGKTALAVHAAHAAREADWFRGGVLFIDLHGYDEGRVQPGQALDALLRALGVPGEHIPEGVEQRAGLYRSALAQVKEPVLVIADNASSEAQVRPLLPGPGPHRVIVTSRHTLAGLAALGARLLDLTVLDQATAVALLDAVVRTARPDDDRVSGVPEAAARLAGACGGLPLAIQVTAALLAADPVLTAGELADELADEVGRLEALRYDDGGGVGAPSVVAAFELSYRQLTQTDEDAARLFRLLPVDPGPDVSTTAAAELVGWPTKRARAALGRLTRAHLTEPAGSHGRWRMHDLLRLYARQVTEADSGERDEAAGRLLAWYLRQAEAADQHLRASAGTSAPPQFVDRDTALAWLDAERPSLVAVVTMAVAAGRTQEAMHMSFHLGEYLLWRRRFDDWLAVSEVGRDSARLLNDKGNEGAALTNLGNALREVGRFDEAISAHQAAAAISRAAGDAYGEARALGNLDIALRKMGRFDEAITANRGAAKLFQAAGDRHNEGRALNNLGMALQETGRSEAAITAHHGAATIYRETGDRHGEAMALNNLGVALRQVQRFEVAISTHQDAATIYRETGDRHGEAMALNNLGVALRGMGRFDEAVTAYQDAVAIFREVGDQYREGLVLRNLEEDRAARASGRERGQ